jgi:hypothetical protein
MSPCHQRGAKIASCKFTRKAGARLQLTLAAQPTDDQRDRRTGTASGVTTFVARYCEWEQTHNDLLATVRMADADSSTESPDAQLRRAKLSPTAGSFSNVPKGSALIKSLTVAVTQAAKDQMCRNLYIYGNCKYEGKGCAFRHDRVCALKNRVNLDPECS